MKIKENILGVLIIILIFGSIVLTSALNLWQTTSNKIPTTFNEGEFAGEYDPSDIRGSYSFGDVSDLFNIPINDLSKAFNLSNIEDISSFKVKYLEDIYSDFKEQGFEIGTDSLRVFVSLYKGFPYDLSEDTYLLKSSLDLLKDKNLSQDAIDFLESNTISPSDSPHLVNGITEINDEKEDEMIVRGKTTFKEVIDWGLSEEDIKEVIKGEVPNPLVVIRDYCIENNITFSEVKGRLQEKIDNLK